MVMESFSSLRPVPVARVLALVTSAALAIACGSPSTASSSRVDAGNDAADDATNDEVVAGQDQTVVAFDEVPVYFAGDDNQRSVDAAVSFPKDGAYDKITLRLALTCPSGGCDPWDRFGSLGVVTRNGRDDGSETVIELARFITPYRVGAGWELDVTDLRPLLSGPVTLRAFIDTWVGPGSQYGDGWLFSATFEMTGGIPDKLPEAVIPVWSPRNIVYGDPGKPIAEAAPLTNIALPKASSYAVRAFVTGHGQGNAGNCAEFCERTHTLTVGATPHSRNIWRADCATTAAPNQQGTYQHSRAGWCPGADVKPWTLDVTDDVGFAATSTFAYDVEEYVNSCRPDATPCTACTPGARCAYDGGAHTEPYYALSTVLIAYR